MAKGMKTGGRAAGTPNKSSADLREAAQKYTTDALQVLVDVMKDNTQTATARIAAATAILDRGHGKPSQHTEITTPDSDFSDDYAQRLKIAAGAVWQKA
jgi:hypothetical protein